ncbi:thioredoxin family protein [Aneurinibacillus aneurinilyticus]|jgi:thioredoxin-like negative regulator of GroEL|uniref:Thioredoxin domain-containing protein n=1 Tax=Aneurinibacillus aneurinilyticus ATCC 12856 TaxID=649747 RepID=U1WJU2_ANEAE|nr:thioredoxin family protein [Aneurinibacillus aneurinilyticus]ERI08844.1 hypothetical protein HMPREF0083_03075 [Aneurinibacillus aneurinilyticus ATCC 12856]MCI1695053.1 thioredoxin family protein [Aneurinibacillus aneurinilyticus]MED0706636.1 thioredoxin family protein [Aneurinibacillus aneurinilyticus]MED0723601.1 thioredoxin family protein [Aneurinibacillus aneurinilyticus]MED0731723.1 thioredoxin family protein [Aneurinibacillus aneurinilyticus]
MHQIMEIKDVDTFLSSYKISLLYISQEACSVCHALLPKVEIMLETFPRLESAYVRIDDVPELAGKFSVFTAPTLILFVEGKEMVRKARFVVMQELEADIKKYYDLVM